MQNNSMEKRMNIISISVPLFAENMLRFLFSFADMFMLSGLVINGVHYGDDAVSAVGLVTTFVFFIITMYIMTNSGAGILITQYNGAGKNEKASSATATGIILAAISGIFVSILFCALTEPVISIYGLNEVRHRFAVSYLTIYSGFSFGVAINTIFSTVLRSYGYSKEPMIINTLFNIVNIFGNYCFINGAFGFPQLGVTGVAISTVFSQGCAALIMLVIIIKKKDIDFPKKKYFKLNIGIMKNILKLGVPSGGEYLSYQIGQSVMNYFVAQMDAGLPPDLQINLPAYNYAFIFARFILYFGLSIGQGAQIITSYLVGSGRAELAYKKVKKYFYFSFIQTFLLAAVLSIFRQPILSIFPMDNNVYTLCSTLVLFTMLLEPGRSFNLVIISSLKGAGDVAFPVKIGIISMWGIGIVFAYIFGVVLNLGIIGIWLGISMDEWTRGIIVYFRWRSRIWQKKAIAKKE